MNDKEIDELIQKAIRQESELPEGLSNRLEQHIDRLAAGEKERSISLRRKPSSMYWFTGVAASLLLGIIVFFQTENNRVGEMADTFQDPQEAAIVAEKALAFLSTQFNKGLTQVSEAQGEVDKVNEIVNGQLNELNTQ